MLGSVSAGRPDWMELPAVLLAIALVLGMLTRIAALLGALLTVVAAPNLHQAPLVVLLLCAMNIGSLACTGAGAYSIDALLFGRSNIRLPGQG